ncbi:tolB protein precursor, periplasmic protein involved in the tonb-independent uptake of group A colicins, partial [hydrothermal vent metagenome]
MELNIKQHNKKIKQMLDKQNILKSIVLCFFISCALIFSVFPKHASADNGKIAYSHVTDGYWQIWIMDTDGTNKKQVTHSHEDKRDPVWMERTKLAYRTNNGALFIVYLEQQETREVFKTYQSINNPDYSSVHQRFVFVRFDPRFSDRSEIWTTDLDEKQAQILTRDKSLKYQPVFSSDGLSIAFVKADKENKMQHHIWTMDTDGKNLKRITSGKGFETHPSFSPDQKYISFTS